MSGASGSDASAGTTIREALDNDAVLVLGLLLAIYVGFYLLGATLGFQSNGIANSLRRVTFLTAVYAMVVLALNLQWGYTGLFNIGVAGFMAVGVYTMAMATAAPDARVPGLGLPLWVGVVLGMLAAALVGLIAALPALRLRADYLAITTIAFSEIIRFTYLSSTFQSFTVAGTQLGTGGGSGIGIAHTPDDVVIALLIENPIGAVLYAPIENLLTGWGIVPNVVRGWVYAVALLVGVLAFYWLLSRIAHSPFGRVLKAIREDEDVAQALGKDTRAFKIKAFMVGCALMGLVGILWQGSLGFVNPNSFLPQVTFFIWIALIIGGAGSNTGSVLGGALFAGLLFEGPRYVANVVDQSFQLGSAPSTIAGGVGPLFAGDPIPLVAYTLANIAPLRLVLVGVVLIVLMHRRPEGLLGHRKETAASIDLGRPTRDGSASAGADSIPVGDRDTGGEGR